MKDKFQSDTMVCPCCLGQGAVEPPMHDHVGERIAWFRRILGMAQDELGKRVNRSRAQISNIEAGRHGIPVSQLKVYASALGVPPHALVP